MEDLTTANDNIYTAQVEKEEEYRKNDQYEYLVKRQMQIIRQEQIQLNKLAQEKDIKFQTIHHILLSEYDIRLEEEEEEEMLLDKDDIEEGTSEDWDFPNQQETDFHIPYAKSPPIQVYYNPLKKSKKGFVLKIIRLRKGL